MALTTKKRFNELTDKERQVIETKAKNPEMTQKEIADSLEDVSPSYVSKILNDESRQDILNERIEHHENQRFEGEETTKGNPFEKLEEKLGDDEQAYQSITERPEKPEADMDRDRNAIPILLTKSDVEQLLSGEVPESVTESLVRRLF